jgi:hypothetical protein
MQAWTLRDSNAITSAPETAADPPQAYFTLCGLMVPPPWRPSDHKWLSFPFPDDETGHFVFVLSLFPIDPRFRDWHACGCELLACNPALTADRRVADELVRLGDHFVSVMSGMTIQEAWTIADAVAADASARLPNDTTAVVGWAVERIRKDDRSLLEPATRARATAWRNRMEVND